ncbi:hypothetical protein, partial [Geobacillus sp. CAMR5420]|uniref:hypothetical protein n=1 Tax=Geobacillus sp. CAMR5420 TaxID=1482739 RepID=UPI0019D6CC34
LLLNLGSICSKMKVLLHGDSPFEWQVALSFYRRSASKGYFYACSSLSSTTGKYYTFLTIVSTNFHPFALAALRKTP